VVAPGAVVAVGEPLGLADAGTEAVGEGAAVRSGSPWSTDGAGVGARDGTWPNPPLGEHAPTPMARASVVRRTARGWRRAYIVMAPGLVWSPIVGVRGRGDITAT
jgi:hypothetical protein